MIAVLPEGRFGRLLALALGLMGLLILWAVIVAPLTSVYDQRAARLANETMLADRMAQVAAEAPALRSQVASHRLAPSPPGLLIAGSTDALAAANLQSAVQRLAGDCGVDISSVDNLPSAQVGPLRQVGLHLHMAGDYPALVRLLGALRDASPAMLPDDLSIAAQGPGEGGRFDIDLTLYAFRT